jgi:hypothetical protein
MAKNSGKLLTGNGLQAFQSKEQVSPSSTRRKDMQPRSIFLHWDSIGIAFVVIMVLLYIFYFVSLGSPFPFFSQLSYLPFKPAVAVQTSVLSSET